ncbi:MAG: peptidoglycan DD-metalloendopeptidase family protein [Clostridia bacterium]|nr:M23 family metallopeptidase [Clostridiales bacterium]
MDKPPNEGPIRELVSRLTKRTGPREKKAFIAVVCIMALLVAVFVYTETTRAGYEVSLNGSHIGVVKDKEMAAEVLARLGSEILESDEGLVLTAELEVQKVKLDKQTDKVLDEEGLREALTRNIELRKKAITLCVDGSPILSVIGMDKAQNLLERVKDSFAPKDGDVDVCGIDIKEKVELVDSPVEPEDIMDPEVAYKYLINGTTESKVYTVSRGDSLWAISRDYNITVEDLEKANPGVNPKKLQVGQQLSMIVPKPFVTVVTEEIVTLKESIPYETEYRESSEFYKGESIVKIGGRYGEKEITARIIRENGIEVDREILDEEVIKEPVTRMVAVGTKPPPPRQGTGTFAYPARGKITSGFGRRWGRMHNGIDIGIPSGTPVKAADGGTVIFSGRQGTYGNLVIIDHGEGFSTYYGHNSQNLVSRGDKVHKGQTIALSGNTGRTTGPHLHFEVRKFGTPVNPNNYLK